MALSSSAAYARDTCAAGSTSTVVAARLSVPHPRPAQTRGLAQAPQRRRAAREKWPAVLGWRSGHARACCCLEGGTAAPSHCSYMHSIHIRKYPNAVIAHRAGFAQRGIIRAWQRRGRRQRGAAVFSSGARRLVALHRSLLGLAPAGAGLRQCAGRHGSALPSQQSVLRCQDGAGGGGLGRAVGHGRSWSATLCPTLHRAQRHQGQPARSAAACTRSLGYPQDAATAPRHARRPAGALADARTAAGAERSVNSSCPGVQVHAAPRLRCRAPVTRPARRAAHESSLAAPTA